MQTPAWSMSLSTLLLAGAAVHASGCGKDAQDCTLALTCSEFADAGAKDDGAGTVAPPPPDCTAPPSATKGSPDPRCGVFAAPGGTGGDGSEANPFASLQAAVDAAAAIGKPVYACAKEFAERIRVPSGVAVYGGLDCDHGWVWMQGKRTQVKAPATASTPGTSEIAARLGAGAGKTIFSDVDVIAPNGALSGVSSIALLVEDTDAEITRATLTAGDGAPGAPGTQLSDDLLLRGEDGAAGFGICTAGATNPGPAGPTKVCGSVSSHGGNGGDGGPPSGTAGGNGEDGSPGSSGAGKGGLGQAALPCQSGASGADGADGSAGAGAVGVGKLSTDGYVGNPGADGSDGQPGQGGGGGGGAKGKLQVVCSNAATLDRAGATGGSGGTGGCGGTRGGGGGAGGSSIAVVILSTKSVVLTDVAVHVGKGGDGGDGGAGQNGGAGGLGQTGGMGAATTSAGCPGGNGGRGGVGGSGGGGGGGHAIGIAYQTKAPKGTAQVTFAGMSATPGKGGAPGAGSSAMVGKGADGVSGAMVQIGP